MKKQFSDLYKILNYRTGVFASIILMAVVPHHLWNNLYGVAIVLITAISYFIHVIKSKEKLDLRKIDFAFILFIITVILGFVTSAMPQASFKTFLFFISSFMLALLIAESAKNKQQLENILVTVLLGAVMVSLYGIWQSITGVEVDLTQIDVNMNQGMPGRIYSTMENANNFAEYLLLVIPIGICLMFNAGSILRKIVFGAMTLLPVICLALTGSRSSWIGFALAIGFLLILKNWKLIPLYILCAAVGVMLLPQFILNRISTIGNMNDTSSAYRLYIWEGALRMLKHYWVTGIGLGPEVFSIIYSNYRNVKVSNATHAHMLPLEIWLELGIAGLLSFVWMVARIVKEGLRDIFLRRDRYLANVFIAVISSFIGILIAGMFEYVWFYPRILFYFWIIAGIMFSAINISKATETVNND